MRSAFIAFLAGFVLFPAPARADDEMAVAEPVPGNGAVLLTMARVHTDGMFAGKAIEVESVGGGSVRRFRIPSRDDGLRTSRAFAGSLPPGRYRIATVCSECYMFAEPEARGAPAFVVEAGRTSYLGGVLAILIDGAAGADDTAHDLAWSDHPDAVAGQRLLQALYPQLAAASTLATDAWENLPGVDPAAVAAAMKRGGDGLAEPMPFAADGFFFGAADGVIKRWDADGTLHLIDTGSPYALGAVVHRPDGRMLVGGEAGTLLYSADDGRHWRDAGKDLPFGLVSRIVDVGADEVAFAVATATSISLYRGRPGGDRWTLLGEYPRGKDTFNSNPVSPELRSGSDGMALAMAGERGMFFAATGGESHEFALPGSMLAFTYSADGVMRCRCNRSPVMLASVLWESRDQGRTWAQIPGDSSVLLPTYQSPLRGLTFVNNSFSRDGGGVRRSDDGGATWHESKMPEADVIRQVAWSADGTAMLLVGNRPTPRGTVEAAFVSRDDGRHWQRLPDEGVWLYPTAP